MGGAVIGGVIGGVLALAALGVLLWYFLRPGDGSADLTATTTATQTPSPVVTEPEPSPTDTPVVPALPPPTVFREILTSANVVGATAYFGSAVDSNEAGNLMVIAANRDNNRKGAVFTFEKTGNVWSEVFPKLIPTGESGFPDFGTGLSVSGDGKWLAVGGERNNGSDGLVWTYENTGSEWTLFGAPFAPSGTTTGSNAGRSVQLDSTGDLLLVSQDGDNGDSGAFYTYTRGVAMFEEQNKYAGIADAGLGADMHLTRDGQRLIVGAFGLNSFAGGYYVFERSGSDSFANASPSGVVPPEVVGDPGAFGMHIRANNWTANVVAGWHLPSNSEVLALHQTAEDANTWATTFVDGGAGGHTVDLNYRGNLMVVTDVVGTYANVWEYNGVTWNDVGNVDPTGPAAGYGLECHMPDDNSWVAVSAVTQGSGQVYLFDSPGS